MRRLNATLALLLFLLPGFISGRNRNYALQLSPQGYVDFGPMPALDNLSSFSLQFWFNPSEWNEDAVLLSRGNDFAVKLGKPGWLKISTGAGEQTFYADSFKPEEWNQITLISKEGVARVLINGKEERPFTLSSLGDTPASFMIGPGFDGMIDEVRIWDDALNDQMECFDYFIFNSLNKWCPQWENLVAYYKMDLADTPYVVDYKFLESKGTGYNNHGIISSDGVKKVEANNPELPYLINAAYTNNTQFYIAGITKDQYLLSNHLLILGADPFAEDGRIETKTPNNHVLSFDNTLYNKELAGKSGVVTLSGAPDSYIKLPGKVIDNEQFTFETWIFPEKWDRGDYLLRKGISGNPDYLAVELAGDSIDPSLKIIIAGQLAESSPLPIKLNEWSHIAVSHSDNETGVYVNGYRFPLELKKINEIEMKYPSHETSDGNLYLGGGFAGGVDETVFWGKAFDSDDILSHMESVPMPAIGKVVDPGVMSAARGYYRYDDSEHPGHSSHSQDEWLDIMKSAYDGFEGTSFHLSVQGTYKIREPYGDWREILTDPVKRKRFTSDLADLSGPYDGVELDLEWIEEPELWKLFGVLADEIRASLPEEKEFRISLHNNYTSFPDENMDAVEGFTFQQYGPNPRNFYYSVFLDKVDKFIEKYPREKILTSYATTTSKGTEGTHVNGIRYFIDSYLPSDTDADKFRNEVDEWTYIGPMQTYRRAKHTREQGLGGIFYWDMGNDTRLPASPVDYSPSYNQAVYCSYGINANLNPAVEELSVSHYPFR